jgi:nickel-type superoxide dismutase maturation protease
MARISRRRIVLTTRFALAGVAFVRWAFDRVEVEGTSMVPTFAPGDRLLLVRRWRDVRPGDLVTLPDPRDATVRLVKRVSSVGDEGVEVHGDADSDSTDSRTFGPVPAASITHLVVKRYGTKTAP